MQSQMLRTLAVVLMLAGVIGIIVVARHVAVRTGFKEWLWGVPFGAFQGVCTVGAAALARWVWVRLGWALRDADPG